MGQGHRAVVRQSVIRVRNVLQDGRFGLFLHAIGRFAAFLPQQDVAILCRRIITTGRTNHERKPRLFADLS